MERTLGIDIGGTSVKYGVVSKEGEITNRGTFETKDMQCLEEFLHDLCHVVEFTRSYGIIKVGISSLGIFDLSGLCIGGVENLDFLMGVNLCHEIKEQFPEFEVQIMNDGNAAAVGEYWLGQGKDCSSFFCMTLGTGVGGSFVVDGKLHLGSHFRSGEIGYSNYVSKNQYFESLFSTRGILDQAAVRLGVKSIDGISFVEKVKEKDEICVSLWEKWMEELGMLIANIILLLDVDKVIVGGGISAQSELLVSSLTESVENHLPQIFHGETEICVAKLGNDAGMLGAVAGFFKQ